MKLYPLKFKPIYKKKIWGGKKLGEFYNKDKNIDNLGESWEISAVEGNISVVCNGFLADNDLKTLIQIYKGDLVGNKIFEQFGVEFPLLIKLIDASDDLSIQVHPDDSIAKKRHNTNGKSEVWYILEADKNAELITGFSKPLDKDTFFNSLINNTLITFLNREKVKTGDVFFIPAGRIHAIGKGIVLVEIQQTSDITYRIFDYNRKENGKLRELHNDLAIDVIDFKYYTDYRNHFELKINNTTEVQSCEYFTVNILDFDKNILKDYQFFDSFVVYICIDGKARIETQGNKTVEIEMGETVLLPASIQNVTLNVNSFCKLIEIYIK
jgi:mannose-6-phosphate isomerase